MQRHELQVAAVDLDRWARSLPARGELPRLIRRLIVATTKPLHVDFPGGELIGSPGWDGELLVAPGAGTSRVPEGPSRWELSTETEVTSKATEDYKKRLAGTDAATRSNTTYVAVTAHTWKGKRAWAASRQKKGDWKDVLALDAGDIEAWIDTAPVEAFRIGLLLGKSVVGVQPLDEWWQAWCHDTSPALSGDVVLAGRGEDARVIGEWLASDGSRPTAAVWADTEEEAIAGFAAAVERMPSALRDAWSTRAAVVWNQYAWQELISREGPLLLVPLFREDTAIGAALNRGHRVLVPHGNATPRLGNDGVQLGRIDRPALRQALERLGVPEERSDALARTGRGSLQALRRELGHRPDSHLPAWVGTAIGRHLVPSLLLGHWDATNEVDRGMATALAGIPYDELEASLIEATLLDDPPLRRTGSFWYFAARRDTWRLLKRRFTPSELKRFEDVVIKRLPDPEPRWDLPPDQRWKASLVPPKTQMSPQARQGLVEGLGFLTLEEGSKEHRDTALGIIHGLLAACNANWKVWATLGAGVADLAELAPEEFLATVESSLGEKVPEILKLFGSDRGDPDPFPSPVLHTSLLWSLERLAWSPRYLTRVAKILGSLARQDPGGRYRNRPAASLYGIFCPWLPQTAAELRERLEALSALQSAEPGSAFDLLLAMMPQRAGGEMLMPAGSPRWNIWKPAERQVPRAEYESAISDAALRLLDLAGAETRRWVRIAKDLDRIPIRAREQALAALRREVPRLSAETRSDIWNAIRGLVNSHREFPSAKWALSPEEVSAIEELLPVLEPGDLVVRHAWLFGHHPHLGEEREWDAEQAEIERRRREAVKSLLETRGVEGVRALAETVEVPGFVGRALGHLPLTSEVEDEVLREQASSATAPDEVFVRGFIGGRLESAGPGWRDAVLARHRESWTASRTASVYLMEAAGADTWNRLELETPEIRRAYWARFWPLGMGHEVAVGRPARELLQHDQPVRAVALLGLYANAIGDDQLDLAVEALSRAIKEDPAALAPIAHDVRRLLGRFAKVDPVRSRLWEFEWALLPFVLDMHEHPLALHERMAIEPQFFVDLCTLAFRSEDEPAPSLDESEKNRAMSAYRLLKSWHGPPGARRLSELAFAPLHTWVAAARTGLQASGRSVVGDLTIGEVIGLPTGENGEWPHPAVARLVEVLSSPDVEKGIELSVFNSRGVYSPSGGRAERNLAEKYRLQGEKIRTSSPRMAALLNRLAATYERLADREEAEHLHGEDS